MNKYENTEPNSATLCWPCLTVLICSN